VRPSVVFALIVVVGCCVGCGKKGPPLPPFVHVPAPPPDFAAERRGDEVKLQFTVPSANTDGTRPADIDHIDVYAFTGSFTANDDQLMKLGTRIASVPVKAPKNPDLTTEPDEPAEEPDLREEGIDQGAAAQIEETLTDLSFVQVPLPKEKTDKPVAAAVEAEGPLPGPPREVPWRIFIAVGYNTDGKRGPVSKRTLVPLVPPPSPPATPKVAYDEKAITVTWDRTSSWAPVQGPAAEGTLPARFFGMELASVAYNVYDVSPSVSTPEQPTPATLAGELRLTPAPIAATTYRDTRMDWGKTRCYTVRAFETITGQTLESDAPPPACVTLKDTFPPTAPKNLQHISSEGVISLIWDPNPEPDLAGYLILRGNAPDGPLSKITSTPIAATVFEDKVTPGMRFLYAVQAVDRTGNESAASASVEDAAR
jgi:hypothetical protein